MGDSKAPGRSLSESTGLRSARGECQDRPADFRARNNLQKRLVALLVASRAGELAKPWKSEGFAALALLSVIQHSSVKTVLYDKQSTGGAFDSPTQRAISITPLRARPHASCIIYEPDLKEGVLQVIYSPMFPCMKT